MDILPPPADSSPFQDKGSIPPPPSDPSKLKTVSGVSNMPGTVDWMLHPMRSLVSSAGPLPNLQEPDFSMMPPGSDPRSQRFKQEMAVFQKKLMADGINPAFGTPGHILNAMEGIARVGRAGVSGAERLGSIIGGDRLEKAFGYGARFLLPQDKVGAAITIAGLAGQAERSAALGLKESLPSTEMARTRVITPTRSQRAMGSAISTTTSIPERYASAVVADPTILAKDTPEVAQVSKEYGRVWDKLGIRFDTKLAQKYLNKNYIPGDREAQTINRKLFGIIAKLEGGQTVPPEEALLGRSMAATLERSNLAAQNHTLKGYASGAKNLLDKHLEESGVPEIRDLAAKYFRAIAKEHFESFLPRNKNMSPNALRGMVALKMASDAGGHLAAQNYGRALQSAASGVAMSPFMVGQILKMVGSGAVTNPLIQSLLAKNLYQANSSGGNP